GFGALGMTSGDMPIPARDVAGRYRHVAAGHAEGPESGGERQESDADEETARADSYGQGIGAAPQHEPRNACRPAAFGRRAAIGGGLGVDAHRAPIRRRRANAMNTGAPRN